MKPVSRPPQAPAPPLSDPRPLDPDAAALPLVGGQEIGSTELVEAAEMPLPASPQTFFLGGLFALASLAALYAASAIILPVVLAFILMLLLQPAVRLFEHMYLPRPVGALLVILLVVATLVGLVAALSVPAATWAERLPQGIPRLQAHLVVLKRPIEAFQQAI